MGLRDEKKRIYVGNSKGLMESGIKSLFLWKVFKSMRSFTMHILHEYIDGLPKIIWFHEIKQKSSPAWGILPFSVSFLKIKFLSPDIQITLI